MIEIRLNGEDHELEKSVAVTDLIERLNLGNRRVAVLRNGAVIRGDEYGSTLVNDGDAVEIIHMVGGG